jgi:hypothetical protein
LISALISNIDFCASRAWQVLNSQGLFQSFDYQPSEYGVEKLIAKRERAQHLAILEKWNRPSFVSGSNLWKQKHEEQFPAKDRKPRTFWLACIMCFASRSLFASI